MGIIECKKNTDKNNNTSYIYNIENNKFNFYNDLHKLMIIKKKSNYA